MWSTPLLSAQPVTRTVTTARPSGMTPLQASLAAASSGTDADRPSPHHPITCDGELRYFEDGTFACPHTAVPPEDVRTKFCLDHSIALLLVELAREL